MKKLIALFALLAGLAHAEVPVPQELKDKKIEMIIPFNPGGDTDGTQRFLVNIVNQKTGLNIVILNRAGASAMIGAKQVASAKPDGLTILGIDSSVVINSSLQTPGYVDPNLLTPVAVHSLAPLFLYIKANSNVNTLDELTKSAKSNPNFNVGCNVLISCMYTLDFFNAIGVEPTVVRFKNLGDMAVAVDQNLLSLFTAGATSGKPFVDGNKIKPIASTWNNKLSVYPSATPISKQVPGFKGYNSQLVYVPKGTPGHIVKYYNQVFQDAVKSPEFQERAKQLNIIPQTLSPEAVQQFVNSDYIKYRQYQKYSATLDK
jgi:tripartite-type tricarboxylate transporter receptor subunit TctC